METELENILMTSNKEQMISFMKTHPEVFSEAIDLALGDKQPYSWRSASLVWSCMEENDTRIKDSVKRIINSIKSKNDGHQRELIKILLLMDLSEKCEGILFDLCMNVWEGISKNPSVRITAFKFIVKMAKKYPDLANELVGLTQNHYLETLSPGVKNSVSRMMREFE